MTPKAIVFFDLDGTLLNRNSELDQEVIDAIAQLKKNEVLPVICTGRTNIEITPLAIQAGIDAVISLNGQHITYHDKVIYDHPIEHEMVSDLVEFARQHNDEVAFYNPDAIRITQQTDVVDECYALIHAQTPAVDANYYQHNDVQMMLVFRNPDDKDNDYRNAFPTLEFYRNGPKAMDVITRGQSKGTGIQFFTQYFNHTHIPTYAFGDGSNDFTMFSAVDYPIAMGNAIEALKEQAIYITTSNADHGIINGLRHFQLID